MVIGYKSNNLHFYPIIHKEAYTKFMFLLREISSSHGGEYDIPEDNSGHHVSSDGHCIKVHDFLYP
jgi:hypothetical protein